MEAAQACGDATLAGNWVQQEVLRPLKEEELGIDAFPIPRTEMSELLGLVQRGELDNSRAKEVFVEMAKSGKPVALVMQKMGIESVDESQMVQLCQSLLAENPQVVQDVLAGKQQAIGSLIGKAKQQNPNIHPGNVRQMLLSLIEQMD